MSTLAATPGSAPLFNRHRRQTPAAGALRAELPLTSAGEIGLLKHKRSGAVERDDRGENQPAILPPNADDAIAAEEAVSLGPAMAKIGREVRLAAEADDANPHRRAHAVHDRHFVYAARAIGLDGEPRLEPYLGASHRSAGGDGDDCE
jgi:hypothetical protein